MKIKGRWLALAAVLGMLVQGCASKRDQDLTPQLWTGFMAPTPPAFLSGHMAPLLTNQAGFTGVASLREGTNKNKRFIAPKMGVIRGKTWESIFQRTQLSPVIHW